MRQSSMRITDLQSICEKLHAIDMHMQFNSGGLEALLEADRVAMAPSGATLLTGYLFSEVTEVTAWNNGLLA